MITTHLRNLLTAVVCLFAGVTAQAQFSGTYTARVASNYDTKPVEFKLTEVAATLGTDTTTLVQALNSWTAEDSEDANMFFLADPTDPTVLIDNYTQGGKGCFWVNADGQPQAWGEDNTGLRWYNQLGWDANEDLFTIYIGQFPGQCTVEEVFKPHFVLKLGEKQASFDITITFEAKPEYTIPEPKTLVEKELNIVGEASVEVKQFPRTGWDSDVVTLTISDAVEKLGIESGQMLADILEDGKVLYATVFNEGDVEQGGGMKKDSVSNVSTAGVPGFWMRAVENEAGEKNGECSAARYNNGNNNFFIEAFKYNPESGELTSNLGQDPGVLKGGEKYYTNLYLIFGDKAYRLHYDLVIEEREQGSGVEGMNKVGENTIETKLVVDAGTYTYVSIHPDVDAIASALGCEASAMSMQALDDTDNWGGNTANNGGFWFNEVGLVIAYGANSYFFIEPAAANDYSDLHVGQYPGRLTAGDTYSTNLYFVNGENYYQLTVKLNIVEPQVIDGEFKEVASRTLTFQQLPDNTYAWTAGIDFGLDFVNETLGTADWVVYGKAQLDENGNELAGNAKYTKGYTCTPYPGFWMNKDGRVQGWSAEGSTFGITVGGNASGQVAMIQYPDRCATGDVLKTQVYLVNEETSEMVTLNINYYIVESIVEKEEVGNTAIMAVVTPNEEAQDIDLAPVAEALGTTVDELISDENTFLKGMTSDGQYSKGWKASLGVNFNYNGEYDEYGDMYVYFEKNADGVQLISGCSDEVAEDFSANGQFCFDVNDKVYVFYVNFVSPDVAAGITNVATEKKNSNAIFDLSGRQVKTPVRGLYIQNGKKFVVK